MTHTANAEKITLDSIGYRVAPEIAAAADPGYRTMPIQDAFDWPKVFSHLDLAPGSYQLFDFTSVSKAEHGYTPEQVKSIDLGAFQAAAEAGVIHYFSQDMDDDLYNRSWCLWPDRESAAAAATDPRHDAARDAAPEIYEVAASQWLEVSYTETGEVVFDETASGPVHQMIGHVAIENVIPEEADELLLAEY